MYQKVPLTLSKAQFDKIRKGQPIQLAHHQIGHHGRHHLMLHPESVKKVHNAHRKGKGARIHVSPHELEASGEGLKEFWEGLKNAGNWIKKNIIDTPFYQSAVKPIIRSAVDTGLTAIAPRLGIAAPLATQGVHALGEKTGAFGIYPTSKYHLSRDYSRLISPVHPAMHPPYPALAPIGGRGKKKITKRGRKHHKMAAGSFLPA